MPSTLLPTFHPTVDNFTYTPSLWPTDAAVAQLNQLSLSSDNVGLISAAIVAVLAVIVFSICCLWCRSKKHKRSRKVFPSSEHAAISTPYADFLLLEAAHTCLIKEESFPPEWKAPATAFLRRIKPTLGLKVKDTVNGTGAVVTGACE
jgi:hypothetical protein